MGKGEILMYASTLQTLPLGTVIRSRSCRLVDVVGGRTIAYRWGRDAIWWALETLGIRRGDHVLLPASCCDVVLQPFVERGIHFTLYGLTSRLEYDPEEIGGKIGPRTRAVYVIHYFGFPQAPDAIRDACRRWGVLLIEDCAHALFGSYNGTSLGEFGDAAVFSLRKILPVPDGGCLKLNTAKPLPPEPHRRREAAAFIAAAKLAAYDLGQRSLLPIRTLKAMRRRIVADDSGASFIVQGAPHDYGMSALSRRILAGVDPGEVIARRRAHFAFWLEHLATVGRARPVYAKLPEGVTPYSFPILVRDRDAALALLRRRGLHFEPTLNVPFSDVPGLENPDERFRDMERIAVELVSLPVHQALTPAALSRMRADLLDVLCG